MRLKKIFCMVMACAAAVSCLGASAYATGADAFEVAPMVVRASGKFDVDIPAETIRAANTSFSMQSNEAVTIKGSYAPSTASVDYGLIAPDGLFYSVHASDGILDETIWVDERGSYTLAFRNNSSEAINVTGYVNY